MFDVYVLEKDTDLSALPQEGTYYLITADGAFLHNDTDLFTALVRVKEIPFLGILEPKITPKLEKIPPEVILKAWLFFRKVFRRRHAESELNLYYHKDKKEYLLVCRPQGVSFGSVNYGLSREELIHDDASREELLRLSAQGYRKVGTIHSHCSFEAFHSGTDEHDESEKDGIHITIGHVDRDNFSLVASWAINNNRFPLLPESIILGIEPTDGVDERRVRHQFREKASFFKVAIPLEQQQQIEADFQPTLDEWLEMVGDSPRWGLPKGVVMGEPPVAEPFLNKKALIPVLALVEIRDLRRVRSHAYALLRNEGQIPAKRIEELRATLCDFFNKDNLTEEDLNLAARVNPGRRVYDDEKVNA